VGGVRRLELPVSGQQHGLQTRATQRRARTRSGRQRLRPALRGFTYTELLVIIGIVGALTALVIPLVGRSRASAQSVTCLAHLRQIGNAFFQYAADNDKRFPDPFETQTSWEQLLRKYLSDEGVFRCPADGELFPAVGSSYDWRDTGRLETTFAGRVITDTTRADPVLAFEALPGWHAKGRMNAVMLSGAGQSMDQEACMEDLQQPIRPSLEPPGRYGAGGSANPGSGGNGPAGGGTGPGGGPGNGNGPGGGNGGGNGNAPGAGGAAPRKHAAGNAGDP
jgi:type II secretory pathway pseudopilin PulG